MEARRARRRRLRARAHAEQSSRQSVVLSAAHGAPDTNPDDDDRSPAHMVGRTQMRALVAVVAGSLLLSGCDYFASPLPGFLSGVERSATVDLTEIIRGEIP